VLALFTFASPLDHTFSLHRDRQVALLADERKVAMLFGGGKAATKKAAPKKAAPKKVAAKKPAFFSAPKKPAAKSGGRARGAGPNLQPAPWSPLKDLFSLSAVGGGQGNTLSN